MSFVIAGNSASTGYNLTRSLRFRASASAYLNRTPASATNRKTWTFSAWVKRGKLSSTQDIFSAGLGTGAGADETFLRFSFTSSDQLSIGGNQNTWLTTTPVYRDPSAWYHIVLAFDATQATATNRILFYVNGVQVTAFATNNLAAYVSNQNYAANNTVPQVIGIESGASAPPAGTFYLDGYLAEVNFIDGQALTPSSFGSTNSLTGVWQPARYTGSYGTNGFYLPFTDNSALTTASNVGLGKDFSGNANYWVTNNISITAGVTYDSMTDVPTLTSDTAANFAVLNPLDKSSAVTLTNGNLAYSVTSGSQCRASFGSPTSGLIYFEHKITSTVALATPFTIGGSTNTKAITDINNETLALIFYTDTSLWQLFKRVSGVVTTINVTGTSFPVINDIVQIAYDSTNGKAWLGRNNSWIDSSGGITGNPSTAANPTFTFTAGQSFFPALFNVGAAYSGVLICGQQPFTYTAPTGFVALNTYNLPTSTIVKGNTVMDATLYTGTGATQVVTNAAGFKPDLLWVKARSRSSSHDLVDSVRGVNLALTSNSTQAELTGSFITSLNSNGFTLPANTLSDAYFTNVSGDTLVGWQWQAGQGSSSSNTNGSITSTVSVNASAGFSVVTYTGTGANATVGHGLGVAPQLVILKDRVTANRWLVYHTSLGATQGIYLEDTLAASTSSTFWNNTAPTSSTVSVGTWSYSGNQVMYCWTPIAGFSAFGSYTGNGSTDGPFVYTGFRPKFVMVKGSSFVSNWFIEDSARNGYNVNDGVALRPNLSNAEDGTTTYNIDILSNGFKLRSSAGDSNTSGATFIYAAFAENPTKNALAR